MSLPVPTLIVVAVMAATPPDAVEPQPPPRDEGGVHFVAGLSLAPGLLFWSAPTNNSLLDGYFRGALQLGVLFQHAQIQLEVGGTLPMPLYAALTAGALVPLHREERFTVAWVLRGGVAIHYSPDGKGPRFSGFASTWWASVSATSIGSSIFSCPPSRPGFPEGWC